MSKVGQESGLRTFGNQVYINTSTAAQYGLADGKQISLKTKSGTVTAKVRIDASVMPGVIAVTDSSEAQQVLAICETNGGASFLPTPVKIEKA